jgi:RNA polymerase sigma-70 factor (ECF subfamily)
MGGAESDEALVVRCRGGDAGAFRTLIERYERPLYNAAYRVLGNADDARDVAQAAFVEVAERLDGYDPSHRFFSWIYRIAVNRALNVLRAKGREQALRDLPRAPSGDPETRAAASELADRVQRALMTMSEHDRVVLTLRHFSGCSYREIGEVLGVEEKTVKSRLFEARQRLRASLHDLAGE